MSNWIIAIGLTLAPAFSAAALPPPVTALAAEWRALGSGELRWFGIALYRASLWVGGERFTPAQPFALSIRYARNIGRDSLIGSSIDEIRRLGGADEDRLKDWRMQLERIFPDVKAGETIVGVSVPGHGARFFHEGQPIGQIDDAGFAHAFFSIWLDRRTRSPELRAQLLGEP